jgi:holliday junction DNA helicase RuvA
MIAQLKGLIIEVGVDSAILEVAGVGYEITCSVNTLGEMQAGQKFTAYTYTHVREDILQLFGFSSKDEKYLFTTLLKVNGVGPKMAINILSGATVGQLQAMIESEDVKSLSKLPKVGKKTAEQMILALKGKLVVAEKEIGKGKQLPLPSQREIASALINLGFRMQDVDKVVSQLDENIDLHEGIRKGLSALTSL